MHERRSTRVRCGWLKLKGEEHYDTLREANNLAAMLRRLKLFGEAKSLLRKTVPVARRVLGEGDINTLKSRSIYAGALRDDDGATLADLRECVTTLVETERIARRVLGGAHPLVEMTARGLRESKAMLRARETPSRRA